MANIKLKNAQGTEVTYNNVFNIKLKDTDNNDVNFTLSLGQMTTFMKDTNELFQTQNNGTGVATSIPTEPTRAGYIFRGWSLLSHEYILSNKITLPQTFAEDTTIYAMWTQNPNAFAVITGLGSSSPSNVNFNVDDTFPTSFDEETDTFGNIFVKIPTIYRKIITTEDGQITTVQLATAQINSDYKPYPCFVKEDGVTVMPYILIGKYCFTSNSQASSVSGNTVALSISAGRELARALGNGYQLYDWQMRQLFNDLAMVNKKTVNINQSILLGVYDLNQYVWVDGIAHEGTFWVFSYKPSKYVNNPEGTTEGYHQASYGCPNTSQEIKKLGYDANHPFFNMPSEVVNNGSYNTYYCDQWYYADGNHPVVSYLGGGNNSGLFFSIGNYDWGNADRVRLCYRPI